MKTKILSILALLLTMTQGAWAQTTADIGRVIAADGKMYKTVTLANKVSTASGVVAYVNPSGGGYALSLTVATNGGSNAMVWGSGAAATGSWIKAYTTLSDALGAAGGVAATDAYVSYHNGDNGGQWTAAIVARNYSTARPSGASAWSLPSAGDWNKMLKALAGTDSDISGSSQAIFSTSSVSSKLTAAGAAGLSYANFWTSTEGTAGNVWTLALTTDGGYMFNGEKSQSTYTFLRPFFTFASASNGYVVEYNANGGSGAPAAQSKTHGTALTLSSTVPTRDGYTFAGWATSAEGAVEYSADGSYTTDNDVVLYAKWTPTYTATFADGNDNTGWDIDPESGAAGTTVTVSYEGENKVKSVTVKAKPICALSAVTSAHVGKVIGADGNVYNTVAQANTATTACGVIAYVGAAGEVHSAYAAHKGIAVSLDETLLAYSTVNEDLDSPTNTFATVLTWKNGEFTTNAAVAKGTYPAFTWAAGHNTTPGRVSGASAWFLPSVGQWNLAVRGMTGSDTDLKEGSSNANSNMNRDKLNVVLNAAGASPLGVGNYMMATEYSTTEFWEYIYLGYFDHMGKSAAFAVRPIFTF